MVGMEERVAVSLEEAKETAVSILEGLGVPAKDAEITAEILIDTEAGGVESHGLIRLKDYVDRLVSGQIEPVPQIKINEQGAIAQIDGGYGLGQVVTMKAADEAVKLAKLYGIGAAAVHHSNHFGAAGYYTRYMAKQGCLGFCSTNAGPTVAPYGGLDRLFGTNPVSIGFPAKNEIFCADMATSAVAKGKIRIYAKEEKKIPFGWALDAQGQDTDNPHAALKGILLPMREHKGYGLAMAVDAMCGLLTGANLSCESVSVVDANRKADIGHFLYAVDIAHFLSVAEFEQRAQNWFDKIRDSRPRTGMKIQIPGEPERVQQQVYGDTLQILTKTWNTVKECYQKYAKK